jgi:hypothetical protein
MGDDRAGAATPTCLLLHISFRLRSSGACLGLRAFSILVEHSTQTASCVLSQEQDFIPLGDDSRDDFDSHIIFAASGVHRRPKLDSRWRRNDAEGLEDEGEEEERVYYMGGNGPVRR